MTEDETQFAFLHAPLGETGSGRVRYAAAMHFHRCGLMSDRMLESYRIVSKLDHQAAAAGYFHDLAAAVNEHIERLTFDGKTDVLSGLSRWTQTPPQQSTKRWHRSCALLSEALKQVENRKMAEAIRNAALHLKWIPYSSYPPAEIGEAFANNHTYASLIGEESPFSSEDFDLGLFIIAPRTLYRDHRHAAPELYAPLTGPHRWRFKPGDRFASMPANTAVWNTPLRPHATLTGDVPFLTIYCWTKDVNETAQVIPCNDWASYESNKR